MSGKWLDIGDGVVRRDTVLSVLGNQVGVSVRVDDGTTCYGPRRYEDVAADLLGLSLGQRLARALGFGPARHRHVASPMREARPHKHAPERVA